MFKLQEAMIRLRCFDNIIHAGPLITSNVTKELSKFVTLHVFEKGRTILKQGHRPEAFYFIITGTVSIYKTEKDQHGMYIWMQTLRTNTSVTPKTPTCVENNSKCNVPQWCDDGYHQITGRLMYHIHQY